MDAQSVITIYNLLAAHDIPIWVDGGWGIDALLGEQTRPHDDLDIAVDHQHVERLCALLGERGYHEIPRPDTSEYNFVLADEREDKIDVHTFMFDAEGKHIYGIAYPRESLTGMGSILGQPVRCIALEWVLRFHEQYEPDTTDIADVQALIARFGVPPPRNYVGRV
jgi:lincosamide nucleotidyltransferase A/C/D/E